MYIAGCHGGQERVESEKCPQRPSIIEEFPGRVNDVWEYTEAWENKMRLN